MKRFQSTWILALAPVLCLTSPSAGQDDARQTAVAGLVRTLGYGGAIHQFKNYVLRGDEKYRAAAKSMFDQSDQYLTALDKQQGLSPEEKAAIVAIKGVVKKYQSHLPMVAQLRTQGKTVEEIDEQVAVDDSPAIQGIATLRKPHPWSNVQGLDFYLGYGSGIHNFKNFILRADEKYRARASLGLSKALLIVARYRAAKGLTKAQLQALADIESVVRAYEKALPKVQELVGEGKTAQQIDAVVKLDDAPALAGLAVLRR